MEELPPPPPGTALPPIRRGETRALEAGTRLWRVHFVAGPRAAAWNGFRDHGPAATARFDHHLTTGQGRAIYYAAANEAPDRRTAAIACVAEAFQDTRTIDPRRGEPWLVGFALASRLLVLDLTAAWLTRAGGNQAISSGSRATARAWSRAIYERDVHGVAYRPSTYGPGWAVALYELAIPAVPPRPKIHKPLADPGLAGFLRRAADELGYALL
ncbi:MAG: RES domain-containing protein [Acidobacteria bacterium]|nr:RES domain-containing protein [Acidobacteriota bacterium]